jgi:hypothetical protein
MLCCGTQQREPRESLRDALTVRLNEVSENYSCVRNPWQGKMDHPRNCIAEKGMLEPGPGG